MAGQAGTKAAGHVVEQVTDVLLGELRKVIVAGEERALAAVSNKVGSATERLTEYAKGSGQPGLVAAATGFKKVSEGKSPAAAAVGGGWSGLKEKFKQAIGRGGKGGKSKKLKLINIVETIDVGVPVRTAYNQWTQFQDFPSFMKKVESVEQASDEKTNWKAQIWWSHRTWEATIVHQVPDSSIVWRSKGPKGHVDGSVTFHALASNLTRILVVLEYHPQGLFERTGNIWRAQGRRARLELKHFRRHVMTQTILDPDGVEGWRGEIRQGRIVKDHETALKEEQEHDKQEQQDKQQDEREDDQQAEREDDQQAEGEDEQEDEGEEQEEQDREPAGRRREPSTRSGGRVR